MSALFILADEFSDHGPPWRGLELACCCNRRTLLHPASSMQWIAIALVLGTMIGISRRVQMTAVPQRTALSHAFGALCVTLVGGPSSTCGHPRFRAS
jgi:NAD/NADP transhydrogenase beta subunit